MDYYHSGQRCAHLCTLSETLEERKMCPEWTSHTVAWNISFQHAYTVQQIGQTSATGGEKTDFSTSFVLCFTEMWLCGLIPDSALQLAGFQLFRADWDTQLSGKT